MGRATRLPFGNCSRSLKGCPCMETRTHQDPFRCCFFTAQSTVINSYTLSCKDKRSSQFILRVGLNSNVLLIRSEGDITQEA